MFDIKQTNLKRAVNLTALVLAALLLTGLFTACKQTIEAQVESDKTAPAEVTELKTVAGNGKISLSWKNPADEDLYQVEISASPAAGTLTNAVYLKANKNEEGGFIVENLTADTDYTFTVKTIDKTLNESTGITTGKVQTLPAGTPMTLTLSQSPEKTVWTKGNVVISFTSTTSSVKTAKWARGVKSAKDVLENGTVITERKFEVSENGVYSAAVQDNEGRREVETIQITNIDKTAPQAPVNLTAEYKLSAKKIVLKWTDPADTGSGLKEFKLTYTVNGTNEKSETIAKGIGYFEIANVEPENPPKTYAFSLKAVDMAGNESAEVSAAAKPSEQAEVTGLSVSRKKIDKNDPDKKVTVTVQGSNLTKAAEIKITATAVSPVLLSNVTDSGASAEFTLPDTVKDTLFKVYIKHSPADTFTGVDGITVKTQVCKSP